MYVSKIKERLIRLKTDWDVRDTLRVSLSSIIPRSQHLVAAKQAQGCR